MRERRTQLRNRLSMTATKISFMTIPFDEGGFIICISTTFKSPSQLKGHVAGAVNFDAGMVFDAERPPPPIHGA